jgi:hypothetical protein
VIENHATHIKIFIDGCNSIKFDCQNEFKDTFPDSPVPNKSTVSRLVNRFLSLQKTFTGSHQT